MPIPDPHEGLIVGYEFVWKSEEEQGIEEGKKRPCAIVACVMNEDGKTTTLVIPITHTQPEDPESAILIPEDVKKMCGLDDEECWVICSEVNVFEWPGPDLRPVSEKDKTNFVYGTLPGTFFKAIKAKINALKTGKKLNIVARSS